MIVELLLATGQTGKDRTLLRHFAGPEDGSATADATCRQRESGGSKINLELERSWSVYHLYVGVFGLQLKCKRSDSSSRGECVLASLIKEVNSHNKIRPIASAGAHPFSLQYERYYM